MIAFHKSGRPLITSIVGTPACFGDAENMAVGRIVALDPDGSSGFIDDNPMHSIVLWGTPHGTVIKTGVLHLFQPNEADLTRLRSHEQDAESKGLLYSKYPECAQIAKSQIT